MTVHRPTERPSVRNTGKPMFTFTLFNFLNVCTALPTLLGPRTLITHGLQRLMGCILPTMHCRSQHCWKLLHPFADHCQHVSNNATMLGFVASVCTQPKKDYSPEIMAKPLLKNAKVGCRASLKNATSLLNLPKNVLQ